MNGILLGYITKNNFNGRVKGENYNFTSELGDLPNFYTSNMQVMLNTLQYLLDGKKVKINMSFGRNNEDWELDMFKHYMLLPDEVNEVVLDYSDEDSTYETCDALVTALNEVGWTCEYYLDASPYGLKKQ